MDTARNPRLIILYGRHSTEHNAKQQRMIDGECTCMYREFAKRNGLIVYLAQQTIRERWEMRFTSLPLLFSFLSRPELKNAIVWSVKHDPVKDRVLAAIPQQTMYYSCNAENCSCEAADVSLVDCASRYNGNTREWFKGKDPEVWRPVDVEKAFDYVLMGRRADKNELYFIERLTAEVSEPRSVLWIAGGAHANRIPDTHHHVMCTQFLAPVDIPRFISSARTAILFTEHPMEGFPQSLLEYVMCGVPVVYNKAAPWNVHYDALEQAGAVTRCMKRDLINAAEARLALPQFNVEVRERYTTDAAFAHMRSLCTPSSP